MTLDFFAIHIDNFKAVKAIIVDLHISQPGLCFVRGKNEIEPRLGANGACKSSLFDALCWCLYGRTVKNERTPDILPWKATKERTTVALTARIGSDTHRIRRSTDPNELQFDGDDISQDQLDAKIGLSFDLFTHTLLLGQGRPLFFDLEPRRKLELFATVLDLERWDERSDKAADRADLLEAELGAHQKDADTMTAWLKEVDGSQERLRKDSEAWEAELQKTLDTGESQVRDLQTRRAPLQRQHDTSNLVYDSAMTELRHIDREREQMEVYRNDARDRLADLRAQASALQRELNNKQELRVKFGNNGKCPICSQPIKGTNLDKHRQELDDAIHNIKNALQKLNDRGAKKTFEDLEQQLDDSLKQRNEFQTKARTARDTLDAVTPQLADIEAKIRALNTVQDSNREQANPYRDELNRLKKRKSQMQTELADLERLIKLKRRKYERAFFWVKGFKDVRLHIIEDVLQELELCSNAMLEDMGLIGWSIRYSIEKETKKGSIIRGLHVLISSPSSTRLVRWESWSGGEGQRLRLIGALALSEVLLNHAGVEAGLEILDEPTQHLSIEGVRDLVDYLAERARMLNRQCVYVDHRAIESSRFAKTYTVTRSGAGVRIE